jgi:sulfite oxidase
MEMLKTLKIGELDLEKEPKVDVDETDPYKNDPERHPALKCHSAKPANMEPPLSLLRREYLTPSSLWFVRNHSPVPIIDAATHEITIVSGEQSQDNLNLLRTKAVINLEHLKKDFEKKTVVATVQCGGNRRGGLDLIKKSSGTGWGEGAISTAKFAGASLRDVLEVHAGINLHNYERLGIKHVIFYGADDMRASIPIEKALSPFGDVLLAYEMNDCEELPRDHGYPLRVIVPGHVGVRNVKWLSKIKLCSEEADGPWNRGIAYKGFGPGYSSVEGLNIDSVPTMQEMPIQSVVAEAENISLSLATTSKNDDGEKRTVAQTSAKGFAWSGGGRAIIRVDVSANKGLSWQTATLKEGADQPLSKAWAWTFWEIDDLEIDASKLKPGDEIKVLVKAVDASYNAQPEGAAAIWNLRGLNNNSWHAFTVKVEE